VRRILRRKKYVYIWAKYSLEDKQDKKLRKTFKPTFRTLSVTTSQKRKGRESKYLSRGVSWRQAAGN